METLYTPAEVAEILKIKEHTVRQWLRNKELRGVKLGGIWRIKESALKQFVDQNETRTEKESGELPKEYFTPAEVAEKLRVEQARVRVWLRNGKLKGTMVGGRWEISKEALEEIEKK